MSRFDDELRRSLRRETPPADLADRVLARARAPERPAAATSMWRWALGAAAVAALSVAPLVYVQHLRTIEGERARAQVLAALRVAGSSLRSVQERVSDVEARRDAPVQ